VSGLVLDTSAVMAILTRERGHEELAESLASAQVRVISAGTLIELGIVLEARLGPAAGGIIERFLRDGDIDVVPVDRSSVDRALEGWRRFGRGRHPAALNLGDLFAYGLAASMDEPVLCTGGDFPLTDVAILTIPG
jgi:ribonuclease VapC